MDGTVKFARERKGTFADYVAQFVDEAYARKAVRTLNVGANKSDPYAVAYRAALMGFGRRVRSAVRMRIAAPLPTMAKQVSHSRPSSVLQALPLCRLPAPVLWLEWDGAARRGDDSLFCDRGGEVPDFEGVLYEVLDDSLQWFRATMCWRHLHLPGLSLPMRSFEFDLRPDTVHDTSVIDQQTFGLIDELSHPMAARKESPSGALWKYRNDVDELAAAAELELRGRTVISPYARGIVDVLKRGNPPLLGRMLEAAESDLMGEGGFVVSILALLNARNASERVECTPPKGERIRFGGPMLLPHYNVGLALSKVALNRLGGGTVDERAAHLVRGHFKVRKTSLTPEGVGLFWWNPHIRGASWAQADPLAA